MAESHQLLAALASLAALAVLGLVFLVMRADRSGRIRWFQTQGRLAATITAALNQNPRIERNLARQRLKLDCRENAPYEPQRLVGSLAQLGRVSRLVSTSDDQFVSAAALIQKAKQFDDGLYAAVELAALHGCGARPGKTQWLSVLRAALGNDAGAVPLYAAARMLDPKASVPEPLAKAVTEHAKKFLASELQSKPISFYTWSAELASLFRHDRMLQGPLEKAQLETLLRALHGLGAARTEYESYLGLIEGLTNPLTEDAVRRALHALDQSREELPKRASLLPPSVSHETELIKKLYGAKSIPDDFELMSELIEGVRSGSVDLRPTAESGWFDHQVWSLEPMAVPEKMAEAAHLTFTSDYRSHLKDLLKSTWALARETHFKQTERPAAGAALRHKPVVKPKLFIRPELSCEPLVTHYRRRADSYRFVRHAIEGYFGAAALRSMHRLTIDGPVTSDLDEELAFMERLFDGAAHRCELEIGIGAETTGSALDTFAKWNPKDDPDLNRDVRMMVPVFYDVERRKTKVWVVLGWATRELRVSFAQTPDIIVRDRAGADVTAGYDIKFLPDRHTMAFPQFAEVYVDQILDREEFRELCDRHGTREAILAALCEVPKSEVPKNIDMDTLARILGAIPWEKRGAFLAAAYEALRHGEIRAMDLSDWDGKRLRVSKAVQGSSRSTPIANKTENDAREVREVWHPELQRWLVWRVEQATPECRLRGEVALFWNPAARNPAKRWTSDTAEREWRRACKAVGVDVPLQGVYSPFSGPD
jgi:hypothetical protein